MELCSIGFSYGIIKLRHFEGLEGLRMLILLFNVLILNRQSTDRLTRQGVREREREGESEREKG